MKFPKRNENESVENFISRCMSDDYVKKHFPDPQQLIAICTATAMQDASTVEVASIAYNIENFGFTETITEDNFYIPAEAEYIDVEDSPEEWDIAQAKPGLWENIRKKKEREGKNYRPAKRGDKDRPDPEAWKKAQNEKGFEPHYMYDENGKPHLAKTYEDHLRMKKMGYTHDSGKKAKGPSHYKMYHSDDKKAKGPSHYKMYHSEDKKNKGKSAEYQGRKVTLNKPFRTPDGPKKFAVYTKNESGNVVIVRFGDPNMEIKRDNPARRKSFRARHKCDTAPGPKWKARYWSCKMW
tara:strand:- start:396 stop:1280 length:885 start_codon:yes stop_codon:yes gene_type:complete